MSKRPFDPETDRIVTVTLDPTTITSVDPDEVHEWRVASYDLIDSNKFYPARVQAKGPYALHLSIIHNHIVLDVRHPETFSPIAAHYLSLTPFRGLIRDYFRVRESYYEAIRSASTFQIEAVDMGRRGLHNQAAELLIERLDNKLVMDLETARRLFSLICAVQPYAARVPESDGQLPTILFVCSMNSVRSPIAAALARRHYPGRLIARSAGVRSGKVDHFVHQVMEEIGIDMSVHTPHTMDELLASHFDVIITLADEARDAVAARGLEADHIEHWSVPDPSEAEGNRDTMLAAYRALRETLDDRLGKALGPLLESSAKAV